MFGMGMGGFGFGGNSRMRALRLGALALLLVAGVVFHRQGSGYEAVRAVYVLAVIALLGYSFIRRRSGVAGGRAGGWRSGPPPTAGPPSDSSTS